MLQTLYIKNYALIDETRVEFHNGLVTITGETGAGKSILLGALGLIIGNRADTSVLRDKENKCIVEAVFDIKYLQLQDFFTAHELDYEELTIIRREILPGGKSRAFINDTPVQLVLLKNLGESLIDIHSQHETLQLRDENFQAFVLDTYSGNEKLIGEYSSLLSKYKTTAKELKDWKEKEARIKAEYDFNQYQYNELEAAGLEQGEQEKLEDELRKGEHAEEIKSVLTGSLQQLSLDDGNLIHALGQIKAALHKIANYDKEIKIIAERLDSAYVELKDINDSLEELAENTEFNPESKLMAEERLDVIYGLQKKHRVHTIDELLRITADLQSKLLAGENLEEVLLKLENELKHTEAGLRELANLIHQARTSHATGFEKEVKKYVNELGISDAQLKVLIEPAGMLLSNGMDHIKYLFTANKGMQPEDVNKVASGGEVSRLMLAIKAIISGKKNLPTIIFDEIDTGVSGNIADKLGQLMQKMGKTQQVIAITHLPQIASKGNLHMKVEKAELQKKTISTLRVLSEDERIQELAMMLSGEMITEAAMKNARVLLKGN